MFTAGSRAYFDALADLPSLDPAEIRRLLTIAYTDLLARKLDASVDTTVDTASQHRYLRRLVTALETSILADAVSTDHTEAAAFVAAESAYLLLGMRENGAPITEPNGQRWSAPGILLRLETSLLYAIAAHDSNARIVARETLHLVDTSPFESVEAASFAATLLELLSLEQPGRPAEDATPAETLEQRVRRDSLLWYAHLVNDHNRWLHALDGVDVESPDFDQANHLNVLLSDRHPDIGLFTRLAVIAMESMSTRALRQIVATVDGPRRDSVADYVGSRAVERPLLWPPAKAFLDRCLLGDEKNAVVAVPTGSGKGFLAEIAIVHALSDGWVAYLVPTNALANQVRQDLRDAFAFSRQVRVQAFFGGSEYTELDGEAADEVQAGTIVVMTPEKCSLALRRSPRAFSNLSLLVFDECHLIGEQGSRGVAGELVVSQILANAPHTRVLFLSALLANPGDLATWLERATGQLTGAIASEWRPTRTLRGFVGLEPQSLEGSASAAAESLSSMRPTRKNESFESPYRLLMGLQGVWDTPAEADYLVLDLPLEAELRVHRELRNDEWHYEVQDVSWVNSTAARLSQLAVEAQERVLTFLSRSKHDPFVVAGRMGELPHSLEISTRDTRITMAHLECAEYELGTESEVGNLLRLGIGVHSGAILDAEKNASEHAFQSGLVHLMLATGTLAQGLNLPATVAISAGTSLAGGRAPGSGERLRAQILNALGRAGRAEFSNHGLALVVSDKPLRIRGPQDRDLVLQRADFMADEDTSVQVNSQLVSFLQLAASGDLSEVPALSIEEMAAVSYLPLQETSEERNKILARSYAAFQIRDVIEQHPIDDISRNVAEAGRSYIQAADAPDWTREVGYRAGVPLPVTFAIFEAVLLTRQTSGQVERHGISNWINFTLDVLKTMPSQVASRILWSDNMMMSASRVPSGFTFSDSFQDERSPGEREWNEFRRIIELFVAGESMADIARMALGLEGEVDSRRTSGSQPIPKTLSLTRQVSGRLALVAGAIAATFAVGREAEESSWNLSDQEFAALQACPIALRTGCSTYSSLGWFRFGLRYRRPSHLLARAFPVPESIRDDDAVAEWVRAQRRAWLDGAPSQVGLDSEEVQVLDAIRILLTRR